MSVHVKRRPFTVDEYYEMARAGILTEDDRVELIEGEILEMAAIGSRHAACVRKLNRIFGDAVGDGAIVSIQDPVRLSDLSEPEPDVVILRPRSDFYAESHPGPDDVLLLVEVAHTTADFDREVKVPLYARAGVREAWIVDLSGAALELFRDPAEGRYREVRTLASGDVAEPGGLPGVRVEVEGVLA